jgi:hypothetical protein
VRVVGYILVTLGALWILFAGGCTLLGLIVTMSGVSGVGAESAGAWNTVWTVAGLGAVGIVPGALAIWGGRAILRRHDGQPRASRTPEAPTEGER